MLKNNSRIFHCCAKTAATVQKQTPHTFFRCGALFYGKSYQFYEIFAYFSTMRSQPPM